MEEDDCWVPSLEPTTASWPRPLWILIIAVAVVFGGSSFADEDSSSSFSRFVEGIGETVFAVAWPTAEFDRVSFGGVRTIPGGTEVRFRLHGTSAFSGGPLWTDVVLEYKNGQITDLRFGNHNAFVPPGTTAAAIGALVVQLAEEWADSSSASSSHDSNNLYSPPTSGTNHRAVVEQQMSAERGRVTGYGYRESYRPFYESLSDKQSYLLTVQLQRGHVYRISGYCDQDCSDLDLYLLNSSRQTLSSDLATDDFPKLNFTPQYSGEYTVKIYMATCTINPCFFGVGVFEK